MRRAPALLAALLLAGCPIPQPLPDYPAGTITPPRIVVDGIVQPGTFVPVPAGCPTPPSYDLSATLVDVNTFEQVVARWFVNYDPSIDARSRIAASAEIPGSDASPPQTARAVPPFTFRPYAGWGPIAGTGGGDDSAQGAVHVVDLVVSNGFDPLGEEAPLPNRSPAPGFETQLHRWVFVNVPVPVPCDPDVHPACCPAPSP